MLFHPVTGLVRTTGLWRFQSLIPFFVKSAVHLLLGFEVKTLVLRGATIFADQVNSMLSNGLEEFRLQSCQQDVQQ